MVAKKNLSGNNDRECYKNHHCKRQRHQPNAARPPKKCAAAVCAAPAEKPSTENYETERQYQAVSNPCRHRLAKNKHMMKNHSHHHNTDESEAGLPRHAVAKKARG